mmetsp:Transcript_105642/g.281380  ORF Transcript_105642/g.281380 Transcript_105642/m.281380 type:complete len:203 (+) Transcript_105642:93-701(+)
MGQGSSRPTKKTAQPWQSAECPQGRSCVSIRLSMQTTQSRSLRGSVQGVAPVSWRAAATSNSSTTAGADGRPGGVLKLPSFAAMSTLSMSRRRSLAVCRAFLLQSGRGRAISTRSTAAFVASLLPCGSCWQNCSQSGGARGLLVAIDAPLLQAFAAASIAFWLAAAPSCCSARAPGSASCSAERPRMTSRVTTPKEKMSEAL